MVALQPGLQAGLGDVGVDLGGGDVRVAQQQLHGPQVGAIAERVVKTCKEAGVGAPRVEGEPACDWVLIDAGDVIVHLFRPEVRSFYNIEKIWAVDAPHRMPAASSN